NCANGQCTNANTTLCPQAQRNCKPYLVGGTKGLFREAVEDVHQLAQPLRPFGIALGDPFRHAPFDVELEDDEADAIQRRFSGGELLEDFDTEARVLAHATVPAHLSIDPIQPGDDGLLLLLVQHAGPLRMTDLWSYRNMTPWFRRRRSRDVSVTAWRLRTSLLTSPGARFSACSAPTA